MKELGILINQRRLKLNLSLVDAAQVMRINQKYLIAIEKGASEDFVSQAHYRGYLKQYLKLLELEQPDLSFTEAASDQDLAINMPMKDKVNPSFKFSLIILALTILVYMLANNYLSKAATMIGDIYAS